MLYNGRRLFITNDKKRKNYSGIPVGANTVECPAFRLNEGINYITFVGLENYQGRLFYATKEEIMQFRKPVPNINRFGHRYAVYAPPINALHEIDINDIDLDAFEDEEYDKKTSSKLVKATINEFKNIISALKKNGKDITKLPLNAGLREADKEDKDALGLEWFLYSMERYKFMRREITVKLSAKIDENTNLTLEESTQFILDRIKYNFSDDVRVIKAEDVKEGDLEAADRDGIIER